jgi:hypothetical protein
MRVLAPNLDKPIPGTEVWVRLRQDVATGAPAPAPAPAAEAIYQAIYPNEEEPTKFLKTWLENNKTAKREATWEALHEKFPDVSALAFDARIWPDARRRARLPLRAPAGRRPEEGEQEK